MNDYMTYIDSIILEVTADEKYDRQYKGKMDKEEFIKAVDADPTSKGLEKVGKYVDWILRNQVQKKTPEEIAEVKKRLGDFDKFKEKLETKDINRLNYASFISVMDTAEEEGKFSSKEDKANERRLKAEKESKKVFEDDNYLVIVPLTEHASKYFGSNAAWCTAWQDDRCMFNRYNNRGTLYIIFNKQSKDKWQMFKGDRENDYEYKDIDNKGFDPYKTFDEDEELVTWMKKTGFQGSGELSQEQKETYAEDFLRSISLDRTAENIASVLNFIESELDMLPEYDNGITADELISDTFRYLDSDFEKALGFLEEEYFIDAQSEVNKTILLGYLQREMSYDVRNNTEYYLDNPWEYTYAKDVEGFVDYFYDKFGYNLSFNGVDEKYLENSLTWLYNNKYDEFDNFLELFEPEWNKKMKKLTPEDKQEIKDKIEKIKSLEYKKQGHPELDLFPDEKKVVKKENTDYGYLDYFLN